MTRKTLLALCSIVLLTVLVGVVMAVEPAEPLPRDLVSPESVIAAPDLSELLAEEAPQMSIEPKEPASAEALPTETIWSHAICYPNTCLPCSPGSVCPLGDRCVVGAICP